MASGYAINGGQSRCFPFWQAVTKCYVETDRTGNCTLLKEDYIECLHHRKAKTREQTIRREFQKLRAEALEESKRQAEIYKSMGPAGGQNATLVERMLAKGAKAAEKGAKVKGGKQDPSAQRPVDFEPFSVVERDGETYLQIPGTRQSSRTEAQERIRVDFEVLSSSKS